MVHYLNCSFAANALLLSNLLLKVRTMFVKISSYLFIITMCIFLFIVLTCSVSTRFLQSFINLQNAWEIKKNIYSCFSHMLSQHKRKHLYLPLTCIFQPLNPTVANYGPEVILIFKCPCLHLCGTEFSLFSMTSYT